MPVVGKGVGGWVRAQTKPVSPRYLERGASSSSSTSGDFEAEGSVPTVADTVLYEQRTWWVEGWVRGAGRGAQ
jgi:hypothetical protein